MIDGRCHGYLVSIEVSDDELGLIVKHLLKMRNVPIRISRIPMKTLRTHKKMNLYNTAVNNTHTHA